MLGAGDQGTVYGYATNETSEKLPLPLVLSHAICEKLDKVMKNGVIKDIGPDGKAQVTVEYEDDKPKRIKTIVVSVQHGADKDLDVLRNEVISQVLWPVFEKYPFDDETEILINPSGRFVEGGPAADTGLTGRKIMVDTYGGLAAHGGGAFSGKEQLVRILNPGDFTGELALFRESIQEAYAEAMSDTDVCMISRNDLQEFLLKYPTISLKILSEFSNRLETSEKQTTRFATEKVDTRLALFLAECMESGDGPMEIELPMSKKDLASYLGTTPETISRKLADLENEGYIKQKSGRKIEILDLDGLLLV
ncbi:methionine adenosyltransferase domain-containing protein [Clostridium sp. UBA1652]|uniref:methionine adenosyltransferase domain-containing protein n=1 Tax=Clostridium sp. UBA1652 TaxID=1946348 RepID=UPI00257BB88B|nr:methionine adenosyltransferase domain-containing protein [Clostridium sp. UBA1652]